MKKEKNNLCVNCPLPIKGTCCHFSLIMEGKFNIILTNHHCSFYDPKTHLCTEYDKRFDVAHHCLWAIEAIGQGGLHEDCLYMKQNVHVHESFPKVFFHEVEEQLLNDTKIKYHYYNQMPQGQFERLYMNSLRERGMI